jgi:hypothetical protein
VLVPGGRAMNGDDRLRLAALATGRRAFVAALSSPCEVHGAPAGQPCWSLSGISRGNTSKALCVRRTKGAGRSR